MQMHKLVSNTQEETTLGLEVPGGKCSKPSGLDEVQADLTVITVDYPEQVLEASSAIRGTTWDPS